MYLINAIRTPDGTVLESKHRHDYKTHIDSVSGEEYMVDGGRDYLRRNKNNVEATELSILFEDATFEEIRTHLTWGSFGVNGDEDIKFIPLKMLTFQHIQNILGFESLSLTVRDLLNQELQYREDHAIPHPLEVL